MSVPRPTKRERREEGRRHREELARRQRRRDTYRKAWIGVGGLAAAAIVGSVLLLGEEEPSGPARPPAGVEDFAVDNRGHVEGPVQYEQDPPAGGDHNPAWLNCAAYEQPIPNENAVHSLEHGAVWITYAPGLPPDDVQTLDDLAGQGHVLVSPYLTLVDPIVVSSWGHQLRLDSAQDPRLEEFIRAFKEGPDTPELGAPCTGGVSPGVGAG
ncbi:MAG: DUF3105 domain-containing protein [Actinomycetota bacterium]